PRPSSRGPTPEARRPRPDARGPRPLQMRYGPAARLQALAHLQLHHLELARAVTELRGELEVEVVGGRAHRDAELVDRLAQRLDVVDRGAVEGGEGRRLLALALLRHRLGGLDVEDRAHD